jgi:phosphoenolpyruvate carboxykinase (GTP)
MDGLEVPAEDLERLLTIDTDRWRQEMGFREEHLKQFDRLPEEIWEAHRRVASALG